MAKLLSLSDAGVEQIYPPTLFALPDEPPTSVPFSKPDPFQQSHYPDPITARKAIADHIGMPLGRLSQARLEAISAILEDTLEKTVVVQRVTELLSTPDEERQGENQHAQ